ncbi:hypothetical protein IBT54_000962 [Pantoea sp. S62]|nr:hypothetical protein [Pantoea sp. S62]
MTTWNKLRKAIKAQGGRSDGLYNKPKSSPLSDDLVLSELHTEAISAYIDKYITKNERMPSYTHLNKQFGIMATAKFYGKLRK